MDRRIRMNHTPATEHTDRKTLHVLYIADQYETGGAAEALTELILQLREQYQIVPVVLTAAGNTMAEKLRQYHIPYCYGGHRQFAFNGTGTWSRRLRIVLLRPLYYLRYYIANKRAVYHAGAGIDFEKIDLIHTNVNRNDIGGVLAKKYNKPHIWHLREHSEGHFRLVFNKRRPFDYMNGITDCFLSVSQSVKKEWARRGLDENKIRVIYDGADLGRCKCNKNNGKILGKRYLKIVCAGEIRKEKGQEQLIQALALLDFTKTPFVTDFYGEGSEQYVDSLKEMVRKRGLSRFVRFRGYCSSLKSIMKNYDIGVNPSAAEGFGRVTVEYMACGLCTLTGAGGVGREILTDRVTGYLYHDVQELADILAGLYETRDMMRQTAERGRAHAMEQFDIRKNTEKIYQLYQECVADRHKVSRRKIYDNKKK